MNLICYGCNAPIESGHYCADCPAKFREAAKGYRFQDFSQVAYAGQNNGLGEYVRSKSHWNELVKQSKSIPAG